MAWQLYISAMTSQETNKIEISMCNPTQLFERCKILKAEKDRAYAEKIRQEKRLIDETIKTNKAIALAKKRPNRCKPMWKLHSPFFSDWSNVQNILCQCGDNSTSD